MSQSVNIDCWPSAVLLVDGHGRVVEANLAAEALFGCPRKELAGQLVEKLLSQQDGRSTARHRNGQDTPVEISRSPLPDQLVLTVVRDLSKQSELHRFRDGGVDGVVHDLKNPLSVIGLQSRLLSKRLALRGLSEEVGVVGVIAESAAYMERLVSEMLEAARAESEQMVLRREPVDLPGFLESVLRRTVSTSDRGRVHLEVEPTPKVWADPNRIERVVVNLVQNAIKYSPPASRIVVRGHMQDDMARISVTDQGSGLTSDEASYVFDRFRRTPNAPSDGHGLGLHISRKIVEAHRGQIGVESTPGHGSTFYFQLPLALHQVDGVVPPGVPAVSVDLLKRLAPLRVLVVDDEAHAVSALVSLLKDEGLDAVGATNGEQALALADRAPPDVAVLDLEMPLMSGLELLLSLRKRQPELPIVLMSGHSAHHAGIHAASESSGASNIGKPVDIDVLLQTFDRLLQDQKKPVAAANRA